MLLHCCHGLSGYFYSILDRLEGRRVVGQRVDIGTISLPRSSQRNTPWLRPNQAWPDTVEQINFRSSFRRGKPVNSVSPKPEPKRPHSTLRVNQFSSQGLDSSSLVFPSFLRGGLFFFVFSFRRGGAKKRPSFGRREERFGGETRRQRRRG